MSCTHTNTNQHQACTERSSASRTCSRTCTAIRPRQPTWNTPPSWGTCRSRCVDPEPGNRDSGRPWDTRSDSCRSCKTVHTRTRIRWSTCTSMSHSRSTAGRGTSGICRDRHTHRSLGRVSCRRDTPYKDNYSCRYRRG